MAKNPNRYGFAKGLYSNMDTWFSQGWPAALQGGTNFDQMRAKPGINHPWVYSVITTTLESYIQCPLRLKSKRDPKAELIDEHAILDLLKAPNPHMSGTNFLEYIVWCLDLVTARTPGGQCFIWGGNGESFAKGQIPDELWLQNDAGVRPVLNEAKILQAWEFDYMATSSPYDYGTGMRLELDEVIRVNNLNPYNLLGGVAPGQAVRVGVEQDSEALELNGNLIKGGGQTRGVFTAKQRMTPDQMTEFRANWEKYNAGAANAGKDKVVPWEMEYTPNSLTPEQMQYAENMGWSMETILAAYKVSKFSVQKYEDLNYATAKEAKRQLFEQAIIPMNSRIMQELNQGWISKIGRGDLELCVDMSQVAALKDDMDARYKRAEIAVQWGVPPLVAMQMQEIPVDDLKGFKWLMENSSAQAAIAGAVNADPAADKPAGGKKPEKLYRIKAKLTADEKRAMCSEYITKVFDPSEKPLALGVKRFLIDQRNRNLDLVDEWAAKHGKTIRKAKEDEPKVEDFVLNAKRENLALGVMMKPHYEAITRHSENYAQMKIEGALMHPVQLDIKDATQAFITRRLKAISVVNRTTFKGVEDKLGETLARMIAEESSNQEIAKAIREDIQETYAGRERDAMRIARTETCVVSGYVQYAAGLDAGIERKSWLDTEDEKTRATHVDANDEGVIPYDQKFANGLDYPGDVAGEAKEVIYCRCALQYHGPA